MLLPSALGFSPHPPVSVYGTGNGCTIAAFLGTGLTCFPTFVRSTSQLWLTCDGFSCHKPPLLVRVFSFPAHISPMRPRSSGTHQYRNINLSSIGYASRPRLRSRLPQSRSALLWKPWIFGRKDSHLPLATHSGILSSILSTAPYGTASSRIQCSSTNSYLYGSSASVSCFSPGNFRRRTSRPVSYYALFQCMAASEPTSWLSLKSHILYHLTRTLGP